MRATAWIIGFVVGITACESTPASEELRPRAQRDAGPSSIIVDGGIDSAPDPASGLGILTFLPSTLYSGFDGTHAFVAPVAVYDAASDLEVDVDSAAATITPVRLTDISPGKTDNGKYFFVTTKKAGTFTLVARSGGRSTEASLVVTSYGASRWSAGKTRYENAGSTGEPACSQCHAGGAAIDHSPAALAGIPDESVGVVLTTGVSPAGFPISVDHPAGHRWTLSASEREGLVTFLRALPPRGFSEQ